MIWAYYMICNTLVSFIWKIHNKKIQHLEKESEAVCIFMWGERPSESEVILQPEALSLLAVQTLKAEEWPALGGGQRNSLPRLAGQYQTARTNTTDTQTSSTDVVSVAPPTSNGNQPTSVTVLCSKTSQISRVLDEGETTQVLSPWLFLYHTHNTQRTCTQTHACLATQWRRGGQGRKMDLFPSSLLPIGMCIGKNLAIQYTSRYRGSDTIYCDLLRYCVYNPILRVFFFNNCMQVQV